MRRSVVNWKVLTVLVAVASLIALALPAFGGGRPLHADLAAANEVSVPDSTASGTADLTLNQGRGEICVDISSSGFVGGDDDVVAGHIHSAPAGVNGPIVVNLFVTSADHSICVDGVDRALIKAIRQNPSDYYVNVHTTEFPAGEIRGQLSK